MPQISLVVAVSDNGMIGQNNQLLWHLSNDLKRFKAITLGKPIIMGRKTYQSIGRPLPGRKNIIVTHQKDLTIAGCEIAQTVEQALALAGDVPEIMVIGGGEIYQLFLPRAQIIHMTQVHTQIAGDTQFVTLDPNAWEEVFREEHAKDPQHEYDYSFVTLRRISPSR